MLMLSELGKEVLAPAPNMFVGSNYFVNGDMSWTSVALALTYIDHKRGLVKLPICSVVTEDDLKCTLGLLVITAG